MEGYATTCFPLTNETLATDSRDTYFLYLMANPTTSHDLHKIRGWHFLGGNVCVFVVSGHKAWLCAMSLYSNSVRAVHDSVIPGRNFAVCTRLYVTSVSQFFAFDHKPSLKMSFTSYQNSPVPVNNEDFSLKEKSESLPMLNYVCLKCYCK